MTIDSGQWTIFVAAALLFLLYRKFLHPAVDESAVQMLIFKRRENAPTGALLFLRLQVLGNVHDRLQLLFAPYARYDQ